MTWLPEWDTAAQAIVAEVVAEPIPELENAGPAMDGWYWRHVGEARLFGGQDAESVRPFATDVRRRFRVAELVAERRLPKQVEELAELLLPYQSAVHRWGWTAESAIRAGKVTYAQLDERVRRQRVKMGLAP